MKKFLKSNYSFPYFLLPHLFSELLKLLYNTTIPKTLKSQMRFSHMMITNAKYFADMKISFA